MRFLHKGLAGRTLASSTQNRDVWPRTSVEDRSRGKSAICSEGSDQISLVMSPRLRNLCSCFMSLRNSINLYTKK